MKIEIALVQMSGTSLLSLRKRDDSSVVAELTQKEESLGSVSVSFPYLIFDETATRLNEKQRQQKILRLHHTKEGIVLFITEDYEGRFWRFVSTIQTE